MLSGNVAVDKSSLVAYLNGKKGKDVDAIDQALKSRRLWIPSIVTTEILGEVNLPWEIGELITMLPEPHIAEETYYNAGFLLAKIRSKAVKAGAADALIAQTCLQNSIPLITRRDIFQKIEKALGEKFLLPL